MNHTLAQLGGPITPPVPSYGSVETGLPTFLNNIITLLTVVGGLLVLFNVIIAGFEYASAAGDPKKVQSAWTRIWQSLMGIVIIVSFIVFAGLIYKLIFQGNINILKPTIKGPGTP